MSNSTPAERAMAETLAANLAVIDEELPALGERLRRPVDGSHIVPAADGGFALQKGLTRSRLSIPRVEISPEALGRDDQALFLFGLGAGEILAHCLTAYPQRQVIAWDRDPSMMRLTLSHVSIAEALRSGRLRLLLGCDLLEELPDIPERAVIQHPLLWAAYGEELFLLSHPMGERQAVICEGGLFVTELTLELQRRGFSVYPMSLSHLALEERRLLLGRVRPQFVAAINCHEGLSKLCADAGCKLLMWEVDPSTHDPADPAQPHQSTAHVFAFTFRGRYVDELRAMGFENVEQLPLAADPHLRKPVQLSPESAARYAAPVSFVGMSMVESVPAWEEAFLRLFCLRQGPDSREQGRLVLADALAKQRRDLSRNLLPELVAEMCRGWPERDCRRLVRCASEIASAERRIITVSRLGRFGIQVWGDEGWRATAGAKVTYRGPAGHYADLNAIYCASRINLDIGRLDQLDIVTMRNFDILACGGFVLAERSIDLEKLFQIDTEIACYATQAELEQKVAHYLAHPEEARPIAAAGRRAVLERHTVSMRVAHMLQRAGWRY